MRGRQMLALIVSIWGSACGSSAGTPDAPVGDAAGLPDGALRDAGVSLPWVDFAASGCASFDPAAPTCRGRAPLVLRFTPLAPAPVDAYLWSFGDGSAPGTSAAPEHRYTLPGSFGVRLTVGGPGGTAQETKAMYVEVEAAGLGDPCDLDGQCAGDLTCRCKPGDGCAPALARGLCTEGCAAVGACGTGGVCVDLGDGTEAWQASVCLRACSAGDCGDGFTCRELRRVDGEWTKACFAAGLLGDEGATCFDADGEADPGVCASASCWAVGARGACAAECGDCPDYAACATFTGGGKRCVAMCSASRTCGDDPWRACEAPGGSGPFAFAVTGAPAGALYCAPRRCTDPEDCGPDGTCMSGYCAAK